MTQHLDTEIRARVTDLEDADLQRIATDEESLLVNRFSLRQDRA